MFLQDFNFEVQYKPGKMHNNAHGLPRQYWEREESILNAEDNIELKEGSVEMHSPQASKTASSAHTCTCKPGSSSN